MAASVFKDQLATAVTEAVSLRAAVPLECIAYSLLRQDSVPCSAMSEEEYCLHHDLQAALQAVLVSVAEPRAATVGTALLAASEAQRRRCSGVDELRAELERVEAERARLLDLLEPQARQQARQLTEDGPPREVQWQEYVKALEPLEPLDVLLEPLTKALEPMHPRVRADGAKARQLSSSPPRRAASATVHRGPAQWTEETEARAAPSAGEAEAAGAADVAPARSVRARPAPLELPAEAEADGAVADEAGDADEAEAPLLVRLCLEREEERRRRREEEAERRRLTRQSETQGAKAEAARQQGQQTRRMGLVRGGEEATRLLAEAMAAREKVRRAAAEQAAAKLREAAKQKRVHAARAQRDALARGRDLAAGLSAMEQSSLQRWEQSVSGGREGGAIVRRLPTGEQVVGRIERHTTRKAPSPKPPTSKPGTTALGGRFFKPGSAFEPGKGLAADTARTGTPLLSYDSAAMAALSNE